MSHKQGFYQKYIKRPQDSRYATAATIVFSPVMGTYAVLAQDRPARPVLFTKERPGLNGKIFRLNMSAPWRVDGMKIARYSRTVCA